MLLLLLSPFREDSTLTAMEGLDDRLGRWLRRMSTAPTTSESMATSRASVACEGVFTS